MDVVALFSSCFKRNKKVREVKKDADFRRVGSR